MLELIVAVLLSLGYISAPEEATSEIINAYGAEAQEIIINTDTDAIWSCFVHVSI